MESMTGVSLAARMVRSCIVMIQLEAFGGVSQVPKGEPAEIAVHDCQATMGSMDVGVPLLADASERLS